MSDAAHILLVGNDGRLLNERAALLSNFWEIAAISSFDEGENSLGRADLLVLCHTMTDAQRVIWITSSHTSASIRPIVSLELDNTAGVGRRSGTVDHNHGPAALVSTIYELLNERGLGSKPWTPGSKTLLGADGLPEAGA